VISLDVSEDVNRVLFAKSPQLSSDLSGSAWKNSSAMAADLVTPLQQIVLKDCHDDTSTDIVDLLGDLKIC
jgi:hypothetical protein